MCASNRIRLTVFNIMSGPILRRVMKPTSGHLRFYTETKRASGRISRSLRVRKRHRASRRQGTTREATRRPSSLAWDLTTKEENVTRLAGTRLLVSSRRTAVPSREGAWRVANHRGGKKRDAEQNDAWLLEIDHGSATHRNTKASDDAEQKPTETGIRSKAKPRWVQTTVRRAWTKIYKTSKQPTSQHTMMPCHVPSQSITTWNYTTLSNNIR
jgi:hypothetical protein